MHWQSRTQNKLFGISVICIFPAFDPSYSEKISWLYLSILLFPRLLSLWAPVLSSVSSRNQHTLVYLQFGLVEVEWTKVLPRLLFSVPAEQCTISGSSRLLLLTETLIIFFISNCKWSTNRVKLFIILLRRWLELKNFINHMYLQWLLINHCWLRETSEMTEDRLRNQFSS